MKILYLCSLRSNKDFLSFQLRSDEDYLPLQLSSDEDYLPLQLSSDEDYLPLQLSSDEDYLPLQLSSDEDSLPLQLRSDEDSRRDSKVFFVLGHSSRPQSLLPVFSKEKNYKLMQMLHHVYTSSVSRYKKG
jgi:hypothetical protein